jgi:hypothetical protein
MVKLLSYREQVQGRALLLRLQCFVKVFSVIVLHFFTAFISFPDEQHRLILKELLHLFGGHYNINNLAVDELFGFGCKAGYIIMVKALPYKHQFDGAGIDAFGETSGEVGALQVANLAGNLVDDLIDAYCFLQDAPDIGKQRVFGVGPVDYLALMPGAGDQICLLQPAQLLADGIVALPELAFHFSQMAPGAAVQKQL